VSHIYVICPGGAVTGGPELLHQLVALLNEEGRPASIVYHPFDQDHPVPEPYARYGVPVARRDSIAPGEIVVLPELYWNETGRYPDCRLYFWWLSIDNFTSRLKASRYSRLLTYPLHSRLRLGRIRGDVERHLYQSEYAREFLAAGRLAPSHHLSDYIAEEYLQAIADPPSAIREDLVVYNPAKGLEATQAILRRLESDGGPAIAAAPIVGMSRDEVRGLLSRAKVYIDFGNHPGKDRIPREAAAMGACVLVNRRGSAGNDVDIPLGDLYKVDDSRPGFEADAAAKIRAIVADFDSHSRALDPYRASIAAEPDRFRRDALAIFAT
jgi:hypothetical protein